MRRKIRISDKSYFYEDDDGYVIIVGNDGTKVDLDCLYDNFIKIIKELDVEAEYND